MFNEVVINGVEYVPKGTVISQAAMVALGKAYAISFGEGVYDPCCSQGGQAMKEIWDLLNQVNQELKFKK